MKEYWTEFWNAHSNIEDRSIFSMIDEIKLEYLLPLLPKEGKILEVGAGSARLSCFLASNGYETTALDYSPSALNVARSNYNLHEVKGSFIIGDTFYLPLHDDSFDVVMSTGLLEHYKDPMPIIREMVRVLRSGGLFYSDVVPRKFSLMKSLNFLKIRGRKEDKIYEGRYTKSHIKQWLRAVNLEGVRVFSINVIPPGIPGFGHSKFLESWYTRLLLRGKPLWKSLDDSWISDLLGFQYFAYGYKK